VFWNYCNHRIRLYCTPISVMKTWSKTVFLFGHEWTNPVMNRFVLALIFQLLEPLARDAKYPPPHLALSGALSGPDSAALRRTVWFCCRVWLFDYERYSNKKKYIYILFSPQSVPVVGNMFHTWEVRVSNSGSLLAERKLINKLNNINEFFCRIKRTCRTMQGPKDMCKKTRKTGARQSSMGGGVGI